jgi:hypothetical protein
LERKLLALSNWQSQLTTVLRNQNYFQSGHTRFVRNFTPEANEIRTDFSEGASFMFGEISANLLPAEILGTVNISSNKQYDRNIIVRNGGTLNVNNNALLKVPGKSITVEDGGNLIISSSGKIECKSINVSLGGRVDSNVSTSITVQ